MSPRSVLWSLLCCVLMVFASCHHPVPTTQAPSADPELASVDSLMWQQPDSALTRLIPYFDTEAGTAFDRHYAHLLLSELLYKNDYEQTNRGALLHAVDYFDSICGRDALNASPANTFLDARAHYIKGVGYYERDSLVEACQEYLKAVEIMESRFDENELTGQKAKLTALAFSHLTQLFSDQYLQEQCVYFGKLALAYYRKYDANCLHLAWILDEIGEQYDIKGKSDSALYYYHQALEEISDTNVLLYRDIITHLSLINYKTSRHSEISIQQLHRLISKAQNSKESVARSLVLGEIYYHEKQMDSAWYYLHKVFQESESIGAKKQAAEWLIEICKKQNKENETFDYSDFLAPYANLDENQSKIKSQLTEIYKNYNLGRQELCHNQKKNENQRWTLILFVSLFIVILVITILYRKNKKESENLEMQIKKERRFHEIQQKSLSTRLKNSNETLKNALEKIECFEAEQKKIKQDDSLSSGKKRYEEFKQTSICREILNIVDQLNADQRTVLKTDMEVKGYKSFALSNQQQSQLLKTLDAFFPEMISNWKQKRLKLSRKDQLYLCLYLLQLEKMSICVLLQDSYYTCRRHTIKLEETFNCKYGLTTFLMEQINIV